MTRLFHIADLHFGAESDRLVAAFEEACAAENPGLLVAAGDFTQAGRRREFAAARAMFDRIGLPAVGAPGNHDVPVYALGQRALTPWRRFHSQLGEQVIPAYRSDALHVESLHTARRAQFRPDWSLGRVSGRHLEPVIERLAASAAGTRILTCHHPLLAPGGLKGRARTHRGDRAADLAAEACDLVLTGHLHETFVLPAPDEDKSCWFVGTGTTFSDRTRDEAASFNRIDIEPERILITRMAADDGKTFKPGRTWELER